MSPSLNGGVAGSNNTEIRCGLIVPEQSNDNVECPSISPDRSVAVSTDPNATLSTVAGKHVAILTFILNCD
ncbi:hypothetical protein QU516_03080 [Moellerella wisconsensis]|uniref:hypothetical protein n=1 Tax=Moellerella wisconsensis TaxID=158849 RepID=UPI0025B131CB|nr:hypothetical protein [Moellerella wisconsensis]WJW82450.1 hypothetical protein QU516_03080 [Moellerella wisconsensis]